MRKMGVQLVICVFFSIFVLAQEEDQAEIERQELRNAIVRTIGKIGQKKMDEVMPYLLESLQAVKKEIRIEAILSLAKVGGEQLKFILPPLRKIFQDKDPKVRAAAIYILGELGKQNEKIADEMYQILNGFRTQKGDGDLLEIEAICAVKVFEKIGKKEEILRKFFREADWPAVYKQWAIKIEIAGTLSTLKEDLKPVLSFLKRKLNSEYRKHAALAIKKIGPPAKELTPDLIKVLKEKNRLGVQEAIFGALGSLGSEISISVLGQGLTQTNESSLKEIICLGLEKFGAKANSEEDSILTCLVAKEIKVRIAAIKALVAIKSLKAEKPLLKLLKNEKEEKIRVLVIKSFADLGYYNVASTLIPLLNETKKEPMKKALIRSLAKMGRKSKKVVALLGKELKKKNTNHEGLLITLGLIGKKAAPTMKVVQAIFNNLYAKERVFAGKTIVKIDRKKLPAVIKQLVEELKTELLSNEQTIIALGKLGTAGKKAVPALKEVLENKYNFEAYKGKAIRLAAIVALGKIGEESAVKNLRKILQKEKDFALRKAAVEAMHQLGPKAIKGSATLIKILREDKNMKVRIAAANALGAIGPKAFSTVPTLIEIFEEQTF